MFGSSATTASRSIGDLYSEDEIWSCTTCGACEAECPLLIEYIDKIVDLRRGMVDDGKVPQSLQKPLKALESRGNPYGKMEKKRADWGKAKGFPADVRGPSPQWKRASADTLYFRRQYHFLRRPHPVDRPRHRQDSRPHRHEFRHPRRGREGQRPRGPPLRRRDALHGPAGPQLGGHQSLRRPAHRHQRPSRLTTP